MEKSGEDYTLYPDELPDIFTIADAKRGISEILRRCMPKAFLETLAFDSITVAPYGEKIR